MDSSEKSIKIQAIMKLYTDKEALLKKLYYKNELLYKTYFPKRQLAETSIDIVNGIIESMLTGKRKWDVDERPDAYNQVLYYIRSEIQNLQSRETNIIESIDIDTLNKRERGIINRATQTNSDENLEGRRISEIYGKCASHIEEKGSKLVRKIFEGMYAEKSNIEIAKENEVEVKEVENAKRRMSRMLRSKFPYYRIR